MTDLRWISFEHMPDGATVLRQRLTSLETDDTPCWWYWHDIERKTEVVWQRR